MKLTSIDPEELAYSSYSGRPHNSRRKCRAICPDGKVRTFRAGVADTYFTVPVVGRIAGRYVSGHVYLKDEELVFAEYAKAGR